MVWSEKDTAVREDSDTHVPHPVGFVLWSPDGTWSPTSDPDPDPNASPTPDLPLTLALTLTPTLTLTLPLTLTLTLTLTRHAPHQR